MKDEKKVFVGVVIWFDAKAGYGFVDWSDGAGIKQKDLFIHFSDICCDGFKTLKKGQKVSFTIGLNNKGQPKACDVTVEQ